MDARVSHEKVAKVVSALVAASTDNPEELVRLLHVLRKDGLETGLGYVITEAIKKVETKLSHMTIV